jgi:hypothetical protein
MKVYIIDFIIIFCEKDPDIKRNIQLYKAYQ